MLGKSSRCVFPMVSGSGGPSKAADAKVAAWKRNQTLHPAVARSASHLCILSEARHLSFLRCVYFSPWAFSTAPSSWLCARYFPWRLWAVAE